MGSTQGRNRLAQEKSPYLLQHANNPVDWYPWGTEAFKKARQENKPIFLSIGYSTCHWCHVMAHESFEDPQVSRLMNDVFVSIKVDREERPDIDMLYMTVCQMMTGSGGWPLTIIMTPEKQPFFAATYIPRETRFGRVGMLELIPRIKDVWNNRNSEVLSSAQQVSEAIQNANQSGSGKELGEPILHMAFKQLKERYDETYGGFGESPKFPTPHNLFFLLHYWKRTNNSEALNMVEATLRAMRRGGIYDHIGFGFHRYSIDRQWLVPHFEKMLYDQALLAMVYTGAYQVTHNAEYARTVREILTYALRDMRSEDGGFYSAEDADSEGKEGKFYLWKYDEIKRVLTAAESELFIRAFNIHEDGNFSDEATGHNTESNIPYLTIPPDKITAELNIPITDIQNRLESIREKLFGQREKRIHPHRDDKILTDWNGLMIAALARAASVLGESEYTAVARTAVDFIFNTMFTPEGQLMHRYRDGEAGIPAHLDDYAFLIFGLVELYETTFEADYLKKALAINEYMIQHFRDEKHGGFYFTSDEGEELLMRQKEIYDGAIPSGNSIAMLNLLRLGRLTANPDLEEKAAGIGRAFSERVMQLPSAYTQLMMAVDFAVGPTFEVIITGEPRAEDTEKMLEAIRQEFIPNKVVVFLPANTENDEIRQIVPYTGEQAMIDGKATAYVCVNYKCQLPTTSVDDMLAMLTGR